MITLTFPDGSTTTSTQEAYDQAMGAGLIPEGTTVTPSAEPAPPPGPTPPPTPPPTTGAKEGDTKEDAYGTWTYTGGQWRLMEQHQCPYCGESFPSYLNLQQHVGICELNPASPGYRAPGAGAPGTPGAPPGPMGETPDWGQADYPVGSPEWWEMVGGPRAGYMSGLGLLGREYQKPFEQYQASQYNPLQTMWQMASPMAMMGYPSMDPGTGMFSQWAPQYAQDPFAMYGMARGMLGNVMGMSPEQRGSLGMGAGAGSFADLLGMGLRERLGPGASWLQGRVPQMQQQWMAQDPLSEQGSFIDYIRTKYNLGQWL